MQDFVAFAETLADAAGAAIRPYFNTHGTVEIKSDDSPVTIADKAAEAAMRALITTGFPEHGIFGEEFGQSDGIMKEASRASEPSASAAARKVGQQTNLAQPNNYTWVLDPIDGTRAFIAGGTQWGTLIALCENGVPILGILDQPITGERWIGSRGTATLFQKKTIHARPCASLAQAAVSTTSARYFTPEQAARFVKLADQCNETIADGDCYAYGLLARGQRDMVVDAGLKPYDILALVPIIEGAGGIITAWDGEPVTLTHYTNVAAAGDATIHAEVLEILS